MKMRCINTDFLQPVTVTRAEMVLPGKKQIFKQLCTFCLRINCINIPEAPVYCQFYNGTMYFHHLKCIQTSWQWCLQ